MVSPEGKIIDINKSALDTLGYRKEEIKGKPLLSTIYAPSSQGKARKLFEEWKKGKEIKGEELQIITKEGKKRTVLLSAASVKDGEGSVRYSVSIRRDITERKEREKELRKSEEKYRGLFESAKVAIVVHGSDGEILSANPAAEEAFGLTEEQLKEKDLNFWKGKLYCTFRVASEKLCLAEFRKSTFPHSEDEFKRVDLEWLEEKLNQLGVVEMHPGKEMYLFICFKSR